MRVTLVSLVAGASLALSVSGVMGASRPLVLGAKHRLLYGVGWGTPHPRRIFNGGDPSGQALDLAWKNWGSSTTVARGLTWVFTPRGGYYRKPLPIELRAFKIGRCTRGGPLAYTRLDARIVVKPGGDFGRWFSWGPTGGDICKHLD